MIPIQLNYEKTKKGELNSCQDFDLPYAYKELNCVRRGDVRSTWKTPLWMNFFMGVVASAIGIGLWVAIQYDPFSLHSSIFIKIILGLIAMLFLIISLYLGYISLTRGLLVLDRQTRELTFFRFWFSFRPHRRIHLDDIKALLWREFHALGSQDDPGHTYKILVAKLQDGRFASIAIDSPLTIEIELKQAIGLAK